MSTSYHPIQEFQGWWDEFYQRGNFPWALKLKPFNTSFPTTPTNSSSFPFSNFCHVLYFWPSYLVSLSYCFGNTGSALFRMSNSCRLLPSLMEDDSQNKIRTLPTLSTQESLSAHGEISTLSSSSRDSSQLVQKKRSCSDTCLCSQMTCAGKRRHSKLLQVLLYSQP